MFVIRSSPTTFNAYMSSPISDFAGDALGFVVGGEEADNVNATPGATIAEITMPTATTGAQPWSYDGLQGLVLDAGEVPAESGTTV